MNIRYYGGVNLLAGVGRLSIRNLRKNDTFGNQQGTRTLSGLDENNLVSDYLPRHFVYCRVLPSNEDSGFIFIVVNCQKDPIALLSLVENHTDETTSPT